MGSVAGCPGGSVIPGPPTLPPVVPVFQVRKEILINRPQPMPRR
jgi:hypothetical protein